MWFGVLSKLMCDIVVANLQVPRPEREMEAWGGRQLVRALEPKPNNLNIVTRPRSQSHSYLNNRTFGSHNYIHRPLFSELVNNETRHWNKRGQLKVSFVHFNTIAHSSTPSTKMSSRKKILLKVRVAVPFYNPLT